MILWKIYLKCNKLKIQLNFYEVWCVSVCVCVCLSSIENVRCIQVVVVEKRKQYRGERKKSKQLAEGTLCNWYEKRNRSAWMVIQKVWQTALKCNGDLFYMNSIIMMSTDARNHTVNTCTWNLFFDRKIGINHSEMDSFAFSVRKQCNAIQVNGQ